MPAHDPYGGYRQKGAARRKYVQPPPGPEAVVPGNEREAVEYLLAATSVDDLAERADLAETAEVGRAGSTRASVLDAIAQARRVVYGEATLDMLEDLIEGARAEREAVPAVPAEDAPSPELPAPAAAGTFGVDAGTVMDDGDPASATAEAAETMAADEQPSAPDAEPEADHVTGPVGEAIDAAREVPAGRDEVLAWVRHAPDDAERTRRAVAALKVEDARDGGPRSSVTRQLQPFLPVAPSLPADGE